MADDQKDINGLLSQLIADVATIHAKVNTCVNADVRLEQKIEKLHERISIHDKQHSAALEQAKRDRDRELVQYDGRIRGLEDDKVARDSVTRTKGTIFAAVIAFLASAMTLLGNWLIANFSK